MRRPLGEHFRPALPGQKESVGAEGACRACRAGAVRRSGAGPGFKGAGGGWGRAAPPGTPAMVCGGFACSRNALCALNVVYVLVALLLIAVAAWGRGAGVPGVPLTGGAIAVGVVLLLLALLGLLGAARHHQVLLFFYMIILGLVFLVQFGVSCSCLAIDRSRQEQLFSSAWHILSNETRAELERRLDCCGLRNRSAPPAELPPCPAGCRSVPGARCPTCGDKMLRHSDEALKILGGVGLFFSFTEILGVWLAMRYRNQKDPRANPSAFL
ncbi:tetraspanin-31-like [Columba livia]|uniref:tetraspanin-31-like n=1 Tax=Columba livia TaxID=8932 RepID=UPI0031BB155C